MIRVLQVVTHMERGGIETMLMNYHRQIDKSVVQFDYLVHREERAAYDDEIEEMGGRIYRLCNCNPLSIRYRNELRRFFKDHPEYSIVHSHVNCLSVLPLKYAMKCGVPVRISHSHNTSNEIQTQKRSVKLFIKNIIKQYYRTKINKYTTKQFACGQKAGEWLYRSNDFEVIPNAIDARRFRFDEEIREKVRDELGITNDIVFGHVGLFRAQKNHIFLIDILNELVKSHDNVKLILVGNGEEEARVRQKVEILGLKEKVLFLGVRSDVDKILMAMDVFVLPSFFEGLPVSMIEAQASGIPCIISDRVSTECIMTDQVRICSLDSSADVWADAIIEMSKIPHKDSYDDIVKARYDIVTNAKYLQEYYLSVSR